MLLSSVFLHFPGDNVGLSIDGVTIFESTDAVSYLLSEDYDGADEYLSQFALYNFDAYCMGIVFTSIDFEGGVLGLAWIGYASQYGPPGGKYGRGGPWGEVFMLVGGVPFSL